LKAALIYPISAADTHVPTTNYSKLVRAETLLYRTTIFFLCSDTKFAPLTNTTISAGPSSGPTHKNGLDNAQESGGLRAL